MRGDQRKTPHANAMAKGINPNKTPLGAKGKPKGRPKKQTLTNGNCKAKENDELPPPRYNEGNP